MKLMFVINSLNLGGAERMLVKILSTPDFAKDEVLVVALQSRGELTSDVIAAGHKVVHLNVTKSITGFFRLAKLAFLMRRFEPDVIHSWLYQSDLTSGVSALFAVKAPVVWSIRQTDISVAHNRFATVLCAKLCALLSRYVPHAIISNAWASRDSHIALGYDKTKITVIPNGIDIDFFTRDLEAGVRVRRELGICEKATVIGLVARFDSQKALDVFAHAASLIAKQRPDVHFLLCGVGMTASNQQLARIIGDNIQAERLHLLGKRLDVANIMNALDLFLLSSSGEGWPNVVGEAMACGVPCVATDAGDTAQIIGDAGIVVAVGDSDALASAALEFMSRPKAQRELSAKAARQQIEEQFNINAIAFRYRAKYEQALQTTGGQK